MQFSVAGQWDKGGSLQCELASQLPPHPVTGVPSWASSCILQQSFSHREVGKCGETPGAVRGKNVSYSLASHVCLHQLNGFLELWGRITKASASLQACVSIWLLSFWHILLQSTQNPLVPAPSRHSASGPLQKVGPCIFCCYSPLWDNSHLPRTGLLFGKGHFA